MNINLRKLYPEAVRRVEILEGLKKCWPSVVRMAAKYSIPYCLGVNELTVSVSNPQTADMIKRMRGNIMHVLSQRFNYKHDDNFSLIITNNIPAEKIHKTKPKHSINIEISESEVKKYMAGAPDTLPEDINYALSHFKAFIDKKFHK